MKILFLTNNDITRQQRLCKEVETLSGAGHQIVVLDLPARGADDTSYDGSYKVMRLRLWTRNLPRNLLFWSIKFIEISIRFCVLGLKITPDIIHCVDRIPLPATFFISRILGIPYIYDSQEIHSEIGTDLNKPKWLWLWIEKFLSKRAYRIMVTDHFRKELTADILGLDKSQIFILGNYPKIPSTKKSRRKMRDECPWKVGMIAAYGGGIYHNRHMEEIIESLTILPKKYHIAMVGFVEDKYKSDLLLLAKTLSVDDRLVILPAVPWSDLPDYMASADCTLAFYEKNSVNNYYCSPSKVFDSLMAGIPVISGDNPLIVEVLQQNDAGICISDIKPETIANAIIELLDRNDLGIMKIRLQKLAMDKFSWDTQEGDFLQLYKDVILSK